MSEPRDTVTLEKIYAEFGVEPYVEFSNTASDTAVDIDSILFEEMYKEAKKVEVSDEEADQILFELTGEIPLREIHAKLKESEPEPKKEEAHDTEKISAEQEEVIEENTEETEDIATPDSITEEVKKAFIEPEAAESFEEILFEESEEAVTEQKEKKLISLFKRIPKAAYIATAAVCAVAVVFLVSLAFRTVYTISVGDKTDIVRSFQKDARKVLNKSELVFHEDSKIELEQTDRFKADIIVTEPFTVELSHDGKTTDVVTTGAYVDELLEQGKVTLGDYDTVSIPLNEYIEAENKVEIDRVELKKVYKEEVIEAPVEDKSDGADYTYTKEGVNGEALVTYLEKYINGKLTETTEIAREILTEAQATLILSMEHNGSLPQSTKIPKDYIRVMDIECTAYYLPGNYTATGKIAQRGYVAVDPSVIPLGTKMFICSADGSYIYGYAQAEDTGSAVKGNIVDLHMDSYEECIIFGRRDMIAYIIEE